MWFLLAASLLVLQFNKKLSVVLLVVTAAIGAVTHVLDWRALAFLVVLAVIAGVYCKFNGRALRTGLEILLVMVTPSQRGQRTRRRSSLRPANSDA